MRPQERAAARHRPFDSPASGTAVGTTIYRLDLDSPDAEAQRLAERHDRDDVLAGLDLGDADDLVAAVLVDLARAETEPRADRLAKTLVETIDAAGIRLHSKPIQSAAFSVLKAPDMPSLLIELGFLSSRRDRQRLLSLSVVDSRRTGARHHPLGLDRGSVSGASCIFNSA